VTFNTSQ